MAQELQTTDRQVPGMLDGGERTRTRPVFVRITTAGIRESHVHDVSITKEAPNYRVS